jgi:hypothetical protein
VVQSCSLTVDMMARSHLDPSMPPRYRCALKDERTASVQKPLAWQEVTAINSEARRFPTD